MFSVSYFLKSLLWPFITIFLIHIVLPFWWEFKTKIWNKAIDTMFQVVFLFVRISLLNARFYGSKTDWFFQIIGLYFNTVLFTKQTIQLFAYYKSASSGSKVSKLFLQFNLLTGNSPNTLKTSFTYMLNGWAASKL